MICYEVDGKNLAKYFDKTCLKSVGKLLSTKLKSTAGRQIIFVMAVRQPQMKTLNYQTMNKNKVTDVLAFPQSIAGQPDQEQYLGDVVICPAYARLEAVRRGVPFKTEMIRLLTHGSLHLFGFDHATVSDEAKMFLLQESVVEEVLNVLQLPSSRMATMACVSLNV